MLTFENKAFRDIAANAPYEVVEILVNSATYGGGGIYGLYSTVAADNACAPYVFVHEFGHHIAGLADEYYTSDVAYLPAADRVEPWEPNVTALLDPAALKWKDLVTPGTPLPTPWPKEEFERYTKDIQDAAPRDSRGEPARSRDGRALPREERHDTSLLNEGPHARPGRRVRRRQLRGPRLLPSAGRLHHVHARQRAVLRRLPPRDRADPRPLYKGPVT